jgi:hypothetical protein
MHGEIGEGRDVRRLGEHWDCVRLPGVRGMITGGEEDANYPAR